MYALGMTLWEMLHRCPPFNDVPITTDLCKAVGDGSRPYISPRFPRPLQVGPSFRLPKNDSYTELRMNTAQNAK